MTQKTQSSSPSEKFLENLVIVDFNSRSEESKYM